MAFEITRELRGHYYLYTISGVNSKRAFIELADQIRMDCEHDQINNFMLDCAGIRGSLTIGELFEVGDYFAKTLRTCKLAGINTPPEWRNNSFSENVIRNRGGQLEHFPSLTDAERWFSN
jgi:hypothetical protein